MMLPPPSPAPPLALVDARENWAALVDQSAEAARQRFVTPGAGQAAVYLRKEAEARRFLALDPEVQAAQEAGPSWPYLSAEINVTAGTLAEVATIIVALADAWDQAAAAIEALRLAAKATIAEASSQAECRAAAESAMAEWPG
jgi:hypothetical protein